MNHYDVYFALRVLMPRVNNENEDQPAECIVLLYKVMVILNKFLLSFSIWSM